METVNPVLLVDRGAEFLCFDAVKASMGKARMVCSEGIGLVIKAFFNAEPRTTGSS